MLYCLPFENVYHSLHAHDEEKTQFSCVYLEKAFFPIK